MDYARGPRDGQRLTATVKWFNRTKGFGFVTATDGSGDAFLPAAVLAQAGYDEVGEGATLTCEMVEGPKGRAVATITEIDPSTATPRGFGRGPRAERGAAGPGELLDGIVKWFDVARGFGFVSTEDGGKDVFVHISALRRAGVETLATGQHLRMTVQEARRGREAIAIELL